MAAANTDQLRKATYKWSTTITSAILAADTTIPLTSTARLPTDTAVELTLDPGLSTQEVIIGVVSGSNLINCIRGVEGTASPHSLNATIADYDVADRYNGLVNWGLAHANQDGSLKQAAVLSALSLGTIPNGWSPIAQGSWTYGANNGQKEFTVTMTGDTTGIYTPGMKVLIPRSVTPPTQCMLFASASSQYAGKASPTGITFTGAFTCEAWIYLNSYTNGTILSRRDNTGTGGGWDFQLTATGQLDITYGTTTTFTNFISVQSLPLKRWVHVAGVVTSVASKTGAIYINGQLVPSFSSLTAATTLTQQLVDMRVGASGGTAGVFLDGMLSEVRLWSAAQSQANIQANMAINLTGSETNLIGLWKGNGVFTDATANANTLIASGGAIATQASNPYNATEYGIITKASYNGTTTTTLTIFTGTDYTIPNQTFGTILYSTARSPYGFPADVLKWCVDAIFRSSTATTAAVVGVWFNPVGIQLSVPTGAWRQLYRAIAWGGGAAGSVVPRVTLSTANNSEIDPKYTTWAYDGNTTGTLDLMVEMSINDESIVMAALAPVYLNITAASAISVAFRGDYGPAVVIRSISAYV